MQSIALVAKPLTSLFAEIINETIPRSVRRQRLTDFEVYFSDKSLLFFPVSEQNRRYLHKFAISKFNEKLASLFIIFLAAFLLKIV